MKDFDVKAILRKDKKRKDGTCPIYLKVTMERNHLKLPAGMKAEESEWNIKKAFRCYETSVNTEVFLLDDIVDVSFNVKYVYPPCYLSVLRQCNSSNFWM
jgi:hypothetical protein